MLPQQSLRKLGVGINYHGYFHDLILRHIDIIDYIEVSPDIFCEEVICEDGNCSDATDGYNRTFRLDTSKLQDALVIGKLRPVVVHGLSLSIGSASGWNSDYLNILDQYAEQQTFAWHSEHLGFMLVKNQDGSEDHAGLILPMQFTREALDLLCPRIQQLCVRYHAPFLIENTTYYLPNFLTTDHQQWDEIEFLNQLLTRTSCGILLYLYNFDCNALNFGFDPYAALSRLQLDKVIEIHVAGGVTHEGFLLDVHSREVPEAVWDLLAWILPKLPNLCAITYELLEQALPVTGEEKIVAQLKRCKTLWDDYLLNKMEIHHVAA
ncbi:MAG: hypothetical protein K0Q78_2677 [Cellvibrio sp.]|nr:hypothetical protein [Cellvibrio sp.]